MATRTWTLDDLDDLSPGDYLVGIIEGRWEGDEESKALAISAVLYGTFVHLAGMGHEEAADMVDSLLARGVTMRWDGNEIGFDFGDPDDDDDVHEDEDEDDSLVEAS